MKAYNKKLYEAIAPFLGERVRNMLDRLILNAQIIAEKRRARRSIQSVQVLYTSRYDNVFHCCV